MRQDMESALGGAPGSIQAELDGPCKRALSFLEEHLPQQERILCLASAAVNVTGAPTNSVLALTDRRLLFVAPRPQALAWALTGIDNAHAAYGFMVESGGSSTHLGIDPRWGEQFVKQLHLAMAVATVTGNA